MDKRIRELLEELNIKQHVTLVEQPQMNRQMVSANWVILTGLKRRLEETKGNWSEELAHVLWAYCTTMHSTNGESPLCLTIWTEGVIPIEVKELSWRTTHPLDQTTNTKATMEELDFIDKSRNFATLTEAAIK